MNIYVSLYYRLKTLVNKLYIKNSFESLKVKPVKGSTITVLSSVETVKNYWDESDVLLDIGAHHGLFSKLVNNIFDVKKTIMFEPNIKLHKTIKNHLAGFDFEISDYALSNTEGDRIPYS